MVSISRRRIRATRVQRRKDDPRVVGVIILGGLLTGLVVVIRMLQAIPRRSSYLKAPPHPNLHLAAGPSSSSRTSKTGIGLGELYNAIALNIQEQLDCRVLLGLDVAKNATMSSNDHRRRLDEPLQAEAVKADDFETPMDDDGQWMDDRDTADARHLFCLASLWDAAPQAVHPPELQKWKDDMQCFAQRDLLELWSLAQAEFLDPKQLEQVLKDSTESTINLLDKADQPSVHIWSPSRDHGVDFVLDQLKHKERDFQQTSTDSRGWQSLLEDLAARKEDHGIVLDIGSGLGLIGMAVAQVNPQTRIYSAEPAPPNWLLQELNWRCNAATLGTRPVSLLPVGLGATAGAAKYTWRSYITSATRSWTERTAEDTPTNLLEFTVKLVSYAQLLQQLGLAQEHRIDVLNLDCEGCEYNVVPTMTSHEQDQLTVIMGSLHFGYIPDDKKPSSARAATTHEFLCPHEHFARVAKECCAFPDLAVQSSVQGHALLLEGDSHGFPPPAARIRDVTGDLCHDFDSWRVDNHLDDVESDFGWFQMTSMSSISAAASTPKAP